MQPKTVEIVYCSQTELFHSNKVGGTEEEQALLFCRMFIQISKKSPSARRGLELCSHSVEREKAPRTSSPAVQPVFFVFVFGELSAVLGSHWK